MMIQANIRRENSMTPTITNISSGMIRANSTIAWAFFARDLPGSFLLKNNGLVMVSSLSEIIAKFS